MLVARVFVIVPSPKSQNRLVIVPVELSLKFTVSGFRPLVGVAVKSAKGTTAPIPVMGFVLFPALSDVKITLLLNVPAPPGKNRMMTFVELKPGRLKAGGEIIAKAELPRLATPLERVAPPEFVTVKAAGAFEPTAMIPKSILAG